MKSVQYLLFISMVTLYLRFSEQDSIRAIVRGSLSLNWEFKLSIFVKELRGVLLYSIDNGGTQVMVTVTRSDSTQSNKISAIFNQMEASMSLLDLCGCDPCANTVVHLLLRFKDGIMRLTCNHREGRSISLDKKVYPTEKKTDIIKYPVPVVIANMSNVTMITIGNILSYNGTTIVYPLQEEPIGCVNEFYYNNERIVFSSNESTFQPSCPRGCSDNICNGGLCRDTLDGITCDCTDTVQNGRYCNDSLMEYKYGGNNSYEAIKGINQIYFKFTWVSDNIKKHYCLLEIRNEKSYVVLSVKGKILMLNSDTICSNSYGMDYIRVKISNNNLIVKLTHKVKEVKFTLGELIHINVGYEENRNACQIFEGLHDFNFTSSLKQSRVEQSIIGTQSSDKSMATNIPQPIKNKLTTTSQSAHTNNSTVILISIIGILLILAIMGSTFCIINFINKKVISPQGHVIPPPDRVEQDGTQNPVPIYYSLLNYDNIDSIESMDIEGYVVPCGGQAPILPGRNNQTRFTNVEEENEYEIGRNSSMYDENVDYVKMNSIHGAEIDEKVLPNPPALPPRK